MIMSEYIFADELCITTRSYVEILISLGLWKRRDVDKQVKDGRLKIINDKSSF